MNRANGWAEQMDKCCEEDCEDWANREKKVANDTWDLIWLINHNCCRRHFWIIFQKPLLKEKQLLKYFYREGSI